MDRREEILNKYGQDILGSVEGTETGVSLASAKDAMDEYMKECCLGFLKYTLEKMGGHSIDASGKVEIKVRSGEWLTAEQVFENFL